VKAISFKVEQNFSFEAGDCIFKQGEHQPRILIIKRGAVQVRIARQDPETGEMVDYWMVNLKAGSCINVYNSF
jgi:CRP-like cAMP-binding protein